LWAKLSNLFPSFSLFSLQLYAKIFLIVFATFIIKYKSLSLIWFLFHDSSSNKTRVMIFQSWQEFERFSPKVHPKLHFHGRHHSQIYCASCLFLGSPLKFAINKGQNCANYCIFHLFFKKLFLQQAWCSKNYKKSNFCTFQAIIWATYFQFRNFFLTWLHLLQLIVINMAKEKSQKSNGIKVFIQYQNCSVTFPRPPATFAFLFRF
jgi:hypothetical protein